jgi:predicted CoA-substrate-specific enzyme activase
LADSWAGVDVGSTATKAVVIDGAGEVLGSSIVRSGTDLAAAAESARSEAMRMAGDPPVARTVATGYGRTSATDMDRVVTEITCHGRGAYHHFPEAITVVDIGGQDTKVITIDSSGRRTSFRMNRKCSAGTGTFLEEVAHRLDVPLGELDAIARKAERAATLGSFCTVFASTEMLSRIRAGEPLEALVLGAYESVVRRVVEMAELRGVVVLTGGVIAYHPIVADVLHRVTGASVRVPPEPQLVGALGAALVARDGP